MQCLILAGGFATRLWPITEKRAKPLLPLAGAPILTHLVGKIPATIPVTVSTNAVFGKDMQAWAKTIEGRGITVYIEDAGHEEEKLGALGAIRRWMKDENIDDDLLLVAGDNVVGFGLDALLASYRGTTLIAAHDVGDTEQAKRFGTIVVRKDDTGDAKSVVTFEEKPERPSSTLISTGCSVLPRETLPILAEYAEEHPDNIGGIFEELLKRGVGVDCKVFTEPWRDIGSFEAYLQSHKDLVGENTMLDETSAVDERSTLEGSVAIGPKCKVSDSSIKNCVLFGNTVVDDCILEDCVIDVGCVLRGIDARGKMLRAGTVLQRR